MQKKLSFKLNLLLSTFLFTGTYAVHDANSRGFRTGTDLPSVEVNFSVIQQLKIKEATRKKEEELRRLEAEYRAFQNSIASKSEESLSKEQDNNEQAVNNISKHPKAEVIQQKSPDSNIASKSPRKVIKNEDRFVQKQAYSSVAPIDIEPTQKKTEVVNRDKAKEVKKNTENKFNEPRYKPSQQVQFESIPFTEIPIEVAEKANDLPGAKFLPRLKPGTELPDVNNAINNVDTQKEKTASVSNEVRFNQGKPGARDSFIKITEVPRQNEGEEEKPENKVSIYTFPKSDSKRRAPKLNNESLSYTDDDNEMVVLPNKLPTAKDDIEDIEGDNISQFNGDSQDDYSEDLASNKPDANAINDEKDEVDKLIDDLNNKEVELGKDTEENTNKYGKTNTNESSFVSVFNKISNVKKFFDFNKEENVAEKPTSNEVKQEEPELSENTNTEESKVVENSEVESKALIPVEVTELEELVNGAENDENSPVYLDSVDNIKDWKVPESVKLNLNKKIKEKSVSNTPKSNNNKNVMVILPNEVDNTTDIVRITPKPKIKPINKESAPEQEDKVVKVKPKIKVIKPTKKDDISSKKQSKSEKPKKVVKVESSDNSSNKENLAKRDTKPISDKKWLEELNLAKKKAKSTIDKPEKKVDISKFKSLLKNEEEQKESSLEKPVAEKNVETKQVQKVQEAKAEKTKDSDSKEPDSGNILYLEDIAQSLRKNKLASNGLYDRAINNAESSRQNEKLNRSGSTVTELVGNKISLPSNEVEDIKNSMDSVVNKPGFGGLLKIKFNQNQLDLTSGDSEKINELVKNVKNSNKKLEIISYASNDGSNNSRRISLKRAIAVRSAMLEAGLASDMVHVQAAGSPEDKINENSVKILYAN